MTAPGDTPGRSGAPLAGRSIVVTRTREQSEALAAPLQALGAEVLAVPVIEIVDPLDFGPVDEAIVHLDDFDWVVLTSTNAVDRFERRLRLAGRALAALDGPKIAAVGTGTSRALAAHGAAADLVPEDFRAEGLLDRFIAMGAGPGLRVLVPRALEAREILPDSLRARGVDVVVAPVYRTVPATPDPDVLERFTTEAIDAVTFTSPSTVRNFVALLRAAGSEPARALRGVTLASIGPVTTDALHDAGLEATVEADPSTIPALVEALAAALMAS